MPNYVALGSSFASGPGVDPVVSPGCARSGRNYPSLVAARLGHDLVDVTCGGATVDDLLTRRQVLLTGDRVPPQIEAVRTDTDLVTATVGGNDVGYVLTLLRSSYRVAPEGAPALAREFFAVPVDTAAVEAGLAALPGRLAGLVGAVRERAPRARVVLVDYLTVLPEDGGCATLPMAEDDRAYGVDVARRLAAATAAAARETGADLVPASAAGRDHSVCSAEPWVTGWAFAELGTGGVVPYHPNAAGMRAVADLVVDLLR